MIIKKNLQKFLIVEYVEHDTHVGITEKQEIKIYSKTHSKCYTSIFYWAVKG